MNPRSARLAVLGAIVPTLFASVAHAESPARPAGEPAPGAAAPAMNAAEIQTAAVVAPSTGSTFSVVLGSKIRSYHQPIDEGGTPGSPGLTVLGMGGGTRILATRGSAGELFVAYGPRTIRFVPTANGTESPTVTELGDRVVVGLGQAGAKAPWLAVADTKGLAITAFGAASAAGVAVPTPGISQALDLSGFFANDTFGMVAYPAGDKGTAVVRLDDKGAPVAGEPITLDGSGISKVTLTPLGADVLLTQWTGTSAKAIKLSSDGTTLDTKDLPADTLAVIADPKAPEAADAWVVGSTGDGTFTATSWSSLTAAGTAAPKKVTLGTSVQGKLLDGACSAKGCLYVFSNEQRFTYTTIWAPRGGAPKATEVSAPNEPGAGGGGGGRPVYPGTTQEPVSEVFVEPSSGCSAASTHAGGGLGGGLLVGLGALVATARRRRTSSR